MPLPEGLQFLKLGWWAIHIVAIYLVYQYAYRKGRRDARHERSERDASPKHRAVIDSQTPERDAPQKR